MSDFEEFWADLLRQATPEALRRAEETLAVLREGGYDVDLELSVFTDYDDPWLPSVWITPRGKDHFVAARASDHVRQLFDVAYGEDGDVHLNDDPSPVTGFFDRREEPENARGVISSLVAEWIGDLFSARFSEEAEVVEVDLD